jgi:hypothetical protein
MEKPINLRTIAFVAAMALALVVVAIVAWMREGAASSTTAQPITGSLAPSAYPAAPEVNPAPTAPDIPATPMAHDSATAQLAAEQRAQAAAARRAAAEALPFERTFYTGNVLHSGRAEALMRREDFDRELARLEQEMLKDPLAIEQRDAYADKLTAQLEGDPDQPRVSKLVCGVNLCIGAIEAQPGDAFRRWMAKQFVQGRKFNDIQTLTVGPSVRVGNRVERRFVFSTSPAINAIGTH